MQEEIAHARQPRCGRIMSGLLDQQGRVDVARTHELVDLARPLPVTFHRAIDMTPDLPAEAMEDVIATGACRILTSGGAPNVPRGINEIARMMRTAKGRMAIMPAEVSRSRQSPHSEGDRSHRISLQCPDRNPSPRSFRKQEWPWATPGPRIRRYTVREAERARVGNALERLNHKRPVKELAQGAVPAISERMNPCGPM